MSNKEWTIMIYLNGTNDLGVEMERTFKDILNINDFENINIVIQIGKAPIELVKMIRQEKLVYEDKWSGVRRYSIVNNIFKLHGTLDNLNMADYKNLYDFIKWGMNNFKSKRYFLSISGHGFIGATLTELCLDKPYTMGIYELSEALNNINRCIDILFLDICNMNTVEFIYELGKKESNPIKYLITYINNAPLSGFDYKNIVDKLKEKNVEDTLRDIVEVSNYNLVAVKIDHGKLNKIKKLSNELAYKRLELNNSGENYKENQDYVDLYYKIEDYIKKIIVANKNDEEGKSILHFIYYNQYGITAIEYFVRFYYKLAFTKNNYCSNVISNKSLNEKPNIIKSVIEQEELEFRDIESIVTLFNNKNDDDIRKITNEIYKYTKWEGAFGDLEKFISTEGIEY